MLSFPHPRLLSPIANFASSCSAAWRASVGELSCRLSRLEAMIAEAQDPGRVDRITKVERSLDETKAVLHKTIEAVLARGEKLDELVDKSDELSRTSKAFYKEARKTNSCCSVI